MNECDDKKRNEIVHHGRMTANLNNLSSTDFGEKTKKLRLDTQYVRYFKNNRIR